MRNKISNIIWGLVLVFIGVGIAGDILDMWKFTVFFPGWWTLFIIIPCLVSMIRGGVNVGNSMGMIIGLLFLLSSNVELDFDVWKLIIPAVLIMVGLSIIFRGAFKRTIHYEPKFNQDGQQTYSSAAQKGEYSAIFSSNRIRITEPFEGANISAIFGAVSLDLRDAIISGDAVIDATAVFGGIDIFVPSGVSVKVNNVPIFGGVSNKAGRQYTPGSPVIYLNSTCMFGGIDIK